MSLNERIFKEVKECIDARNYNRACDILLCRVAILDPVVYNYLLCSLLFHMVISLSAKGHYLTSATYEKVTALPLIKQQHCEPTSFMQRANDLHEIVKRKNQELSNYGKTKQKSIQFD